MKFTFGIISDGSDAAKVRIKAILHSIAQQDIPERDWEVIIVGGDNYGQLHNAIVLPWQDTTEKPWITAKKNLITRMAKFDNIVFMHDYFSLDVDTYNWYENWKVFGDDWDVAINCIWMKDSDGLVYRHTDWQLDPFLVWNIPEFKDSHWRDWSVGLDYSVKGFEHLQYISGGFFLAKKSFMEQYPLDERLYHNDAEDIEWSSRIRAATTFKMNDASVTWCLKPDKWRVPLASKYKLEKVATFYNKTEKDSVEGNFI